jgi:hypothetical protein
MWTDLYPSAARLNGHDSHLAGWPRESRQSVEIAAGAGKTDTTVLQWIEQSLQQRIYSKRPALNSQSGQASRATERVLEARS